MRLSVILTCYGYFALRLGVLSGQMTFDAGKVRVSEPLSVCAVLEDVDKYHGRMVMVQGVLRQTHRHGAWLEGQPDGQTCPGIASERKDWTPGFDLLWPSNPSVKTRFERDIVSEQELRRLLKESNLTIEDKVIVTLEGLLQRKRDYRVFRGEDGQIYSNGYGAGGAFPARIVIRWVVDMRVSKFAQ